MAAPGNGGLIPAQSLISIKQNDLSRLKTVILKLRATRNRSKAKWNQLPVKFGVIWRLYWGDSLHILEIY